MRIAADYCLLFTGRLRRAFGNTENTYKLNDGLNPAKIGVSDRGL